MIIAILIDIIEVTSNWDEDEGIYCVVDNEKILDSHYHNNQCAFRMKTSLESMHIESLRYEIINAFAGVL